jgi:hypothetical protein
MILKQTGLLLNTTILQRHLLASQTINSCERVPVLINIVNTAAPTGNSPYILQQSKPYPSYYYTPEQLYVGTITQLMDYFTTTTPLQMELLIMLPKQKMAVKALLSSNN